MGQKYRYTCGECGYKTIIVGQKDRGFISIQNTFVCTDCKILFDAEIQIYSDTDDKWVDKNEIVCPTCKTDKIEVWENKVCPKCSTEMRTDDSLMILWD